MTSESKQPVAAAPEVSEPKAYRGAIPVWLIILLALVLYWGMVYFDTQGGWQPVVYKPYRSAEELARFQLPAGEGPDLPRGRVVFEQVCGVCHGNDGAGKPAQAPPLAGSEWVLEPPNRLASIPLVGLSGPITVKGQQYNLSMTAMGASLNDEDLAAVLNYIRMSWGNKGTEVTAAHVKAVRASLTGHPQPMTADEVKARPEK